MSLFTSREAMLLRMEFQQFFSPKRIPVFVLLALIGISLIVQESELSPFIIVFLITFAILESQFNNILFRTPNELDALSMFPISWYRIVLVKNLATIVLTVIVTIVIAMAILYFSPKPFTTSIVIEAVLYSATIIFPLLHVGNIESLRSPRKITGWQLDDAVQAAGMFLFVVVLSFPYIFFTSVLDMQWLNIVYVAVTAWYWYNHSVPKTAFNIEQKKTYLCSTL